MDWYWFLIVFILFILSICLRLICKHACDVEPDYRRNQCENISSPRTQPGFEIGRQHISLRDEYSSMSSPLTESSSLSDNSVYRSTVVPTLSTPYPPPPPSIPTLNSVYPPPRMPILDNVYPPYRSEQIMTNPSDDLPPSYEAATGQISPASVRLPYPNGESRS